MSAKAKLVKETPAHLKLVKSDTKLLVTQQQMRLYYQKLKQFHELEAEVIALRERLASRLAHGQEAGKFRLEKHKRSIRRVAWKEKYIAVTSERSARNVIAATKPKVYIALTFVGVIVNE